MERAVDATPLRDRLEGREITIAGKDGRSYVMRPIRSSDAPSLMRGYDAMTDNSKWFRMLHPVPHLTEAMALEFCTPDPKRDLCVVMEGCGELKGEILGGARIAGSPNGISAEFSVSLRPEAQGLGLARKALETVLAAAKEMGYKQICGSIHARNQRMLCLAQRIGFRLRRDPEDVSLMLAELSL
jgi:RimJ/RimL family protein N-acetyltransferase